MNLQNILDSFSDFESEEMQACHDVWSEVSMQVQVLKLDQNGITDEAKREFILKQLRVRPTFLTHAAKKVFSAKGSCHFAEVGTAEGLQSIMIAKNVPGSQVFTCDIRDVRNKMFHDLDNIKFVAGNSKDLCETLKTSPPLDFCWIDGSHDHYAVVDDFLSLFSSTNENTIWAFDDFDKRFGCYHDLNLLATHFSDVRVMDFGSTASGNPSCILLATGCKV